MEEEVREGKGVGVGGAISCFPGSFALSLCLKSVLGRLDLGEVSGEGLYRTAISFSDVSFRNAHSSKCG